MDSQGALELLTPRFSHPMVKKYAICQLEQADNEVDPYYVILLYFKYIYFISQELLLYLLQLVQALRYDIEDNSLGMAPDSMPLSGFFTDETFGHPGNTSIVECKGGNSKCASYQVPWTNQLLLPLSSN